MSVVCVYFSFAESTKKDKSKAMVILSFFRIAVDWKIVDRFQ